MVEEFDGIGRGGGELGVGVEEGVGEAGVGGRVGDGVEEFFGVFEVWGFEERKRRRFLLLLRGFSRLLVFVWEVMGLGTEE